jgi:cytochrome c
MKAVASTTLLLLVLAWLNAAAAQHLKGDPAQGRQFAQFWCAGCHKIDAKGARVPGSIAPDFTAVANRRSTTTRWLVRFLYSQHKVMPLFEIELDDANHVAAYIMSLRRR